MDKKLLVAIASVALILTGFSMPKSNLFGSSPKVTSVVCEDTTQELDAAAARHRSCQPRHWRGMMMRR